jgi:uncharacterized protein with HEPN domain
MSTQRDDIVYLRHIRDAVGRVGSYVAGLDENRFMENPLVQDAVIRQLQVLGEAAKRLSREFRTGSPEIPWSDIAGMRNKLVHDYMGVDLEVVWETATVDIPALASRLDRLGDFDDPA